jgi:hypothetical protein
MSEAAYWVVSFFYRLVERALAVCGMSVSDLHSTFASAIAFTLDTSGWWVKRVTSLATAINAAAFPTRHVECEEYGLKSHCVKGGGSGQTGQEWTFRTALDALILLIRPDGNDDGFFIVLLTFVVAAILVRVSFRTKGTGPARGLGSTRTGNKSAVIHPSLSDATSASTKAANSVVRAKKAEPAIIFCMRAVCGVV